jgi:hypothetical protein
MSRAFIHNRAVSFMSIITYYQLLYVTLTIVSDLLEESRHHIVPVLQNLKSWRKK